ncbi:hypothetical protein Ancab_029552 [Ancistrocladus abbreviatus]
MPTVYVCRPPELVCSSLNDSAGSFPTCSREDNEQRTECRNESNDEVAGDGNVGLAAENALEKQRRLEGFSSPSVEASLMNEPHIDVDYVATEFQILSPVVMGLSKERDFEKRNKDSLGLERSGSGIAAGLEPNSSE